MGNSCYMNAGLQCVCSVPHFAAYFLGKYLYVHSLYRVATYLLILKEPWRQLVIQGGVRVRQNKSRVRKGRKLKKNVVVSLSAVSKYC